MKSRSITVTILMVFTLPASATEQVPDLLIINGGLYRLPVQGLAAGDQPLTSLWKNPQSELGLHSSSTGCYRGYVAIWELQQGCLYLRGLDAWRKVTGGVSATEKVGLKAIFPERFKNGRVHADWFDGSLKATPADRRISSHVETCNLSFAKGSLRLPVETASRLEGRRPPMPQGADILLLGGEVYYLLAEFSLNAFPAKLPGDASNTRAYLSSMPDGSMDEFYTRGYNAIWEIHEDCLYMVAIDAWIHGMKADLRMIFPDRFKDGRVKADWFTGELSLLAHEIYVWLGKKRAPSPFYAITLHLKDGQVQSRQEHHAEGPNHSPGRPPDEK